jgi:hypothetical protein
VALLNIGTEDIKGNQQVKLAASLLQNARGLNYIGFVEGDGLYRGEADVVVCDGFVGNILLKSSEGLATMIAARIEALFKGGVLARAAGAMAMPLLKRLQADLAPARHNGASFLGLQGIVIKSHGSAGVQGFQSAIQRALIEIQENLPQRLHGRLEDLLLGVARTMQRLGHIAHEVLKCDRLVRRSSKLSDFARPVARRTLSDDKIIRACSMSASLAFVFPGQGSQSLGMLAELGANIR